jgi:ubiquinone/menaquinone biosynthesis C-methylase UbiE
VTSERVLSVDQARAFYDRLGAWQDWQFYEDPPLRRLLQAAKFQAAHSIIEFGCGTGRFALQILSEIAPADCRYLGIDVSPTMAALARARLSTYSGRAELRLSDGAVTIGEPDGSFDRYVSNYVLDLLSRDCTGQLLSEAHRVLEPGGLLCLVSLTHGSSPFQKLVSSVWSRIQAARPALVGGCRPIELLDVVSLPDWRVEFREVVSRFGLSSEVVVAARL